MECRQTDELIMKYMDKALEQKEAETLKKHIDDCEKCRLDFAFYDAIMTGFDSEALPEAPMDFEQAVMTKLMELNFSYKKFSAGMESFMLAALGTLSIFFAAAAMLILNRDQILDYMAASPSLSGIASVLRPLASIAESFFTNLSIVVTDFINAFAGFINANRFIFLGIFAVFAAIVAVLQYARNKKRAVE